MPTNDPLGPIIAGLKQVDDDALTSLSHTPAAQALYEEVTAMDRQKAATGSRRRRLIWEAAGVAALAVIVIAVLSVVDVFGPDGPSIVNKAIAALAPSENSILHSKIVIDESGAEGYAAAWTEESWLLCAAPHTSRSLSTGAGRSADETVSDDTGRFEYYDPSANTIYLMGDSKPGVPLAKGDGEGTAKDMILGLLQSGDAVVDGHETVDGRDVVRIVATKDYGTAPDGTKYGTTYLVDAQTNDPVEWRMTRAGGKNVVLHFEIYEELPATDANMTLLDLAAQHPGAATAIDSDAHQKDLPVPQG